MKITEKKEVLIIDQFLTQNENSVKAIAKNLNLEESTVNKTINKYLSNLTINEKF